MGPAGDNLNEILDQAQRLSNPGDRDAYLDRACGRDSGMRQRIEALLEEAPAKTEKIEQELCEISLDGHIRSRPVFSESGEHLGVTWFDSEGYTKSFLRVFRAPRSL